MVKRAGGVESAWARPSPLAIRIGKLATTAKAITRIQIPMQIIRGNHTWNPRFLFLRANPNSDSNVNQPFCSCKLLQAIFLSSEGSVKSSLQTYLTVRSLPTRERSDLERFYAKLDDEYEPKERADFLTPKLTVISNTGKALQTLSILKVRCARPAC